MPLAKVRFAHRLKDVRRPRLPTSGCGDLGPTLGIAGLRPSFLLCSLRPRLVEMRRPQLACAGRSRRNVQRLAPDGYRLRCDAPPKGDRLIRLPTHGLRQVTVEDQGFRHALFAVRPRDSRVADAGNPHAADTEIVDAGAVAEERRAVRAESEAEAFGIIQVGSPYSQL